MVFFKKIIIFYILCLVLFGFFLNCVPPQHMRTRNFRHSDPKREEVVRTAERYLGVNTGTAARMSLVSTVRVLLCMYIKKTELNFPGLPDHNIIQGKNCALLLPNRATWCFLKLKAKG